MQHHESEPTSIDMIHAFLDPKIQEPAQKHLTCFLTFAISEHCRSKDISLEVGGMSPPFGAKFVACPLPSCS